jgi:hypothetical protein
LADNTIIQPIKYVKDKFGYTASCPLCKRRVLDISTMPDDSVYVRLKCPHCRQIVKIHLLH